MVTSSLLQLLLLPLGLLLLLPAAVAAADDEGPNVDGRMEGPTDARPCTVDDLIPRDDGDGESDIADMWDASSMVPPPFNCTCRTLKASYHCPHLGTGGYPKWDTRMATKGTCTPKKRADLEHEPLPPGFRILFYGNSHLRQVIEGIVCAYSDTLQSRRLNLVEVVDMIAREVNVAVNPKLQCRSCISSRKAMSKVLLENECVSEDAVEQACSCHDNESLFLFDNGAMLHYHFAHTEEDKKIEDALGVHGTDFSDYDAVVANPGNKPHMEVSEVVRVANILKDNGIPLLWMSAYEGSGDVDAWLPEEQTAFWATGARFIPVHRMVESLDYLTKGVVENERNPHFCMPGPPNEIGVLLLKIAWALHEEKGEAARVAGENGEENQEEGDSDQGGDGGARSRLR